MVFWGLFVGFLFFSCLFWFCVFFSFLIKYSLAVFLTVNLFLLPPPPFLFWVYFFFFNLPYAACLLSRSLGRDDI